MIDLLSKKCGLGTGRYRFDGSAARTATEVISEQSDLYQSLKLNVVGGTTQPSSPKPNTVWINTSTALAKLALQATAPTAIDGQALVPGDIWLQTVIASNVHVIVAHKGLAYYVGYAWMYSGSAWARATARYYDTA